MGQSIRQHVTVQTGGRIEIPSSDLPAGARAQVIVMLESPASKGRSLRDMIGRARGCFPTAAEADNFIRGERDAWES